MTTIKDIFLKDIDRSINGVVKADQNDNETVFQELDEYVVTKELDVHFRDFFEVYSTSLADKSLQDKIGIWISGFFGSGKSHFLKILSYMLSGQIVISPDNIKKNAIEFFDESKIRDAIVRANIEKVATNKSDVILFNIDSKAGAKNDGNPILEVFLRVFNEFQGFSSDHPHIAHLERFLDKKSKLQDFVKIFEKNTGSEWIKERDAFHFYQDEIEKTLAEVLQLSDEAAKKWFEESEQFFDVSSERFCEWVKEYLDSQNDPERRILFLVDEIGQFIGNKVDLMLKLQTLAENLGTICKGRAWIIVTAQADMDATLGELSNDISNTFSKIAARFNTRLSLSGSNVDEVIEKRLLRKTESAKEILSSLYDQQENIIKNQISFDKGGPSLSSFETKNAFINSYPFPPYQFKLLQSVFTEIRKVGATGASLSNASRSMLDAFQIAALEIRDEKIGKLVPMHCFYKAVEGFLEPAVKKTFDDSKSNSVFDEFDISLLKTLFMIRYVNIVKGTVDNLVTLSLEELDQDKLALRKKVEASIQRLEKESLITRNGDEYLFLTNEERDITRKIKATDISGSEENKALSDLIYKELLNEKNKFRYHLNKVDYNIGRYLDGHTIDSRFDAALHVEFLTPLDVDYGLYSEAACIQKSTEGEGAVLIKLSDDKKFFHELGLWLKTNKFIRLNDDNSQTDISRILAERGRENQERKKRLRLQVEEMILSAQIYSLGQHLNVKNSSVAMLFDEICKYLLENTFNKLSYLKILQSDPWRELNAVLSIDDIAQLGLSLEGEQGNPQAMKEVEQYIALKAGDSNFVKIIEVIERFTKKPYGWPDAEILLILARLAAMGYISFWYNEDILNIKDAFEPLQNTRKRRDISIIKKRQTDEQVLKQARALTQNLFSIMGPASEKELFEYFIKNFNDWLGNLKSYKSKIDVGHFPGKAIIEKSILVLDRALANRDSYEFFKVIVDNKNEYLDLEEDYRDIHEFFSNQLSTWLQLQKALSNFDKNAQALERDVTAAQALIEMKAIESSPSPYNNLHKVSGLINKVAAINDTFITEKREHALIRIDEKITQLEAEIDSSGMASPELSNRLLRPLQLLKDDIKQQTSIPQIFMLQAEAANEKFDDALEDLASAISVEEERRKKIEKLNADTTGSSKPTNKVAENEQPLLKPKPIIDVSVSAVFSKVSQRTFLESQKDIDQFIAELKANLEASIADGKRVRIR